MLCDIHPDHSSLGRLWPLTHFLFLPRLDLLFICLRTSIGAGRKNRGSNYISAAGCISEQPILTIIMPGCLPHLLSFDRSREDHTLDASKLLLLM